MGNLKKKAKDRLAVDLTITGVDDATVLEIDSYSLGLLLLFVLDRLIEMEKVTEFDACLS